MFSIITSTNVDPIPNIKNKDVWTQWLTQYAAALGSMKTSKAI